MRNILFWLCVGVLLFVGCWLSFAAVGLTVDPLGLVQTYFGVSHSVAFWIVLGVGLLVGSWAYSTA